MMQAVRNMDDLECLACPPKYRALNTFWKYYTGQATAPYPTLFIGGNHEAMNYLWELYYGGWVAPNIYYLGHAGVIKFGGIRIGGLSGIFNGSHYKQGHWERPPYDNSSMRSAYHVRELDVYRLLQIHRHLDVFLSHDWPRGIAHHGNKSQLFRAKPFLQREIEDGSLGSPPAERILHELKPAHWFSAHLHVKYAAVVPHGAPQQTQQERGQKRKSPRRGPSPPPGLGRGAGKGQQAAVKFTKFLALDKCLPRRSFLQVVEFPDVEGPLEFQYDEEWLGVLQTTHHLMSLNRQQVPLPGMGGNRSAVPNAQLDSLREELQQNNNGTVPHNFVRTAPGHDPSKPKPRGRMPRSSPRNPQTEQFLDMLGLPYNLDQQQPQTHAVASSPGSPLQGVAVDETVAANPEEIELDEDGLDDEDKASAEALERTAEAAKQDMADDDGMFHAESLHHYSGSTQAAPDSIMEAHARQTAHADSKGDLPAALAAVLEGPNHHHGDADAQEPTGTV
ncbi:hypothetical protein ABBQ38_006795 [Trebouxia sp. C0009 RCD-2024]